MKKIYGYNYNEKNNTFEINLKEANNVKKFLIYMGNII